MFSLLSVLLIITITLAQDAPVKVPCPPKLIRSVGPAAYQRLSLEEQSYVTKRSEDSLPRAWRAYLRSVESALPRKVSLPSYVTDILSPRRIPRTQDFPKLGMALSGGGLRAAYFAAGVLTSLDSRNRTHSTGTNGVLQAATYLSALSGGGWFTTALIQADFPTVPDLIFPPSNAHQRGSNSRFGGFLTQTDILLPSGSTGNNSAYFDAVVTELRKKHDAGFPVTITDAWGREIARHFVNGTTSKNILQEGPHGENILFSGLRNMPTFKSHSQPFPIILANAIPPTLTANPQNPADINDIIPENDVPVHSEVWEITVFETGSWDPSLGAFIPTQLLGSIPSSGLGKSRKEAQCVVGFDQASYVAGISSNVWNGLNLTTNLLEFTSVGPLLDKIESTLPPQVPVRLDAAAVPNPFKGINPESFTASNESFVALVDGGSNGEVCPLQPLIVRARGVDTIFAIDAVADRLDNFSNGSDLINTASRAARFGNLYPFPKVPTSPDTFVNRGLTSRPTFFGCDEPNVPLVIYLANGAPSSKRRAQGLPGITNIPTAVNTYSPELAQSFMDEAFAIATQGLGTNSTDPGAQWSTCLACALVDRARSRRQIRREGVCATCFQNFCWDGRE